MTKTIAISRHAMDRAITEQKSRGFGERATPLFDAALAKWILLLALPLLFLPKWNLVTIQAETAGLRIDDLVLLGVGGLVFLAHVWTSPPILPLEKAIFGFTLVSLCSFFLNKLLVHAGEMVLEAKIFYVFRLAEYFLFFYIGRLAVLYVEIRQLFLILFGWNALWMLLQKGSWVGGWSVVGYMDVSARVQGIASFPSEMGLWLNLLFCWFFFDEEGQSRKNPLLLLSIFLACTLLTVWTGNRISMMALFLAALWRFCRDFSQYPPMMRWGLFLVGSFFFAIGWLWIATTEPVVERSKDLLSWKNFSLIEEVWDHIIEDPLQPANRSMEEFDVSWWLRIHKWVYILKLYLSQPLCYLQGMGPGVAWSALDGGWLRIWTETGFAGLFLFVWILRLLGAIHRTMRWMVFVWLLNAIFFDAYLAYKPMSLLFFTAGCLYDRQKQPAMKKNLSQEKAAPVQEV